MLKGGGGYGDIENKGGGYELVEMIGAVGEVLGAFLRGRG